jgi:hypothetical protein
MSTADRADELRRHPETCLYCPQPADSNEHIIPDAIGGHLKAPILCRAHNVAVGRADKALSDHYTPVTFASTLKRQRGNPTTGKYGASVKFIDAQGREVTVAPDGTSEFGLEITETNDAGVPQRASGPERKLRGIAKNHPDPNGFRLFQVAGPGVTMPIGVGIGPESLPGYLKIALHFAAGFVGPVSEATLAALAPAIFGKRPARVLMQLPFRAPYFNPAGPVRHEVTIYPDGTDAIATVMLFSSFCVTLALPHFVTRIARRYTQYLDGTRTVADVEAIPIPRERLSDREWDQLFATAHANLTRIFNDRGNRDIEEIAHAAARKAFGSACKDPRPGAFFDYFRAELIIVPLEQVIVEELVTRARDRAIRGLPTVDDSPMLLR